MLSLMTGGDLALFSNPRFCAKLIIGLALCTPNTTENEQFQDDVK